MTARTICAERVPATDLVLLRSMMALIPGRTRDTWRLDEQATAADLLVLGDGDDAPVPHRLRAVVSSLDQAPVLPVPMPLRPRTLVDFLDQVTALLAPAKGAPPQPPQPTLADLLFGGGDRSLPAGRVVICDGDHALLELDAGAGFCRVADQERLLRSVARRDLQVRTVAADGPGAGELREPARPVLWRIGLACEDTLVAPVAMSDVLQVARWPDYSQLVHRSEHLRMTAVVTRHPMTVPELARRLDLPLATVTGFANALLLSGHARAVAPSAAPSPVDAKAAPAARLGLLSRIRSRLGL